jgi:TPP-dependent pyruvate/acetoin dehydrogenase alpha subunit
MLERFYRSIYRIRRVEERIAEVYPTDKIQSPVHLSIGQEAVSVAVCEALEPDDVVFGTYRCHAFYLAKGGDLRKMVAELYGKATGCARGKAGSMHLIDTPAGVMGASAVVGTTIPHAVGYALALQMQGRRAVVACFFGDGAVEEGVFHESLNFAALKRVPILFICENNGYAIHSTQRSRQAFLGIAKLARGYGIPAERIEDLNVLELHARVQGAVDMVRAGGGPRFFEVPCYRWKEHVGPNEDFQAGYRDRAEAQPWYANDPLRRLAEGLPAERRAAAEQEVEAEIDGAFRFAEASPFPGDHELYTDLYQGA